MDNQDNHNHTISGLPNYTLDLDHHHHHHHHHHNDHSTSSSSHIHHGHDLDHDASLAAEFFASADDDDGTGAGAAGDLSLSEATLAAAGVPFLPDEEIPPQSQTPVSRPKKRKLQLACHFCRRRKLKCDGIHPTCENCMKRNETCNWDESVRRRGPGKRTKAIRDKAADEAAAAGLHEATGLDSSAFSVGGGVDDTASSVADTNAALIAAVTAAAAEGNAAGMEEAFGTELGDDLYGGNGDVHEGHISPLPTGTPVSSSAALLAHAIPSSKPPSQKDPNIDPSLVDLTQNPSTLAEASSPKLVSATTTQPSTQHIYQPPQLPRKLPGVGVGVNVQAPNFGQVQQTSTVNNGSVAADILDLGTDDLTGENASAVDPNNEDVLEWSKGYNFSTWPDLDLGSGGREL